MAALFFGKEERLWPHDKEVRFVYEAIYMNVPLFAAPFCGPACVSHDTQI